MRHYDKANAEAARSALGPRKLQGFTTSRSERTSGGVDRLADVVEAFRPTGTPRIRTRLRCGLSHLLPGREEASAARLDLPREPDESLDDAL
jgi:hypothetical protein